MCAVIVNVHSAISTLIFIRNIRDMIFYSNKLTTNTSEHGRDYKIKVTKHPTWFGKLFGFKVKKYTFIGECTVWHHVDKNENLSRASTSWEWFLCEVLETHKHKTQSSRR